MLFLKRSFLLIIGVVVVLFFSSCGNSTNSNTGSSSLSASTPVVAALVKTASATVDGKAVTILTNAQGMTLYYFTPDTGTKAACTGSCASSWPPLLFAGTGSPTAATKLPGELEVYTNANGKQVIYNDHPLYTYSGDSASGQTNGQGVGGKWFVATTDLAKNTATASSVTPTPASTGIVQVKTASATVGGKAVTILTNAQGMTLYYFTPDTATKSACTAGCAGSWPPLLFTGTGSPQAATKLPGELEVYANANGKQVVYNDHPLYTFSGDSAPGQTNGQGIGGKWFVATTDLAKNQNK